MNTAITARMVSNDLSACADRRHAHFLQAHFKSPDGSELVGDDTVLGLRVPQVRAIVRKYETLPLGEIEKLLLSWVHEERLAALLVMVSQTKRASLAYRQALYELYVRHIDRVNNWNLVDASARDIVGEYLLTRHGQRDVLYGPARSSDVWQRRIAIVSTWAFIRKGDFNDTFRLAEMFLCDIQPYVHKATGWMLREVGKRDVPALKGFLDKHAHEMPRIMLRYAIEHFSPQERLRYMQQKARRAAQ